MIGNDELIEATIAEMLRNSEGYSPTPWTRIEEPNENELRALFAVSTPPLERDLCTEILSHAAYALPRKLNSDEEKPHPKFKDVFRTPTGELLAGTINHGTAFMGENILHTERLRGFGTREELAPLAEIVRDCGGRPILFGGEQDEEYLQPRLFYDEQ